MSRQDKLPVLAFPKPHVSTPAPPRARAADPDVFAQAVAALRGALEAEVTRQSVTTPEGTPPAADSFTPIGAPKVTWRAGADLPRDTMARSGRSGSGRAGVAAGAVARPDTDRSTHGRRITVIHLPHFAMERWQRWAARQNEAIPDDLPVALAQEGPHGPIIHATNRAAALAGVHAGARVVDMRALCPELHIAYADLAGDRAALKKLMYWTRRWCPWTATDGPDGLVLETTGSDHLCGGEPAMLRDIEERLSHLGLTANLATAPTHGAAWALARFGPVRASVADQDLARQTAPLPVRALRLQEDTLLLLKRLGLKTIGDLAAVPRISLARRFSRADLPQNPLMRLDQLMGQMAEPVAAPDDPPRFAVQSRLAEPVQDPTPHLPELCRALCSGLHKAGFGARRVTVTVYRTDGEVRTVTVATALASRDPDHLHRLFDGKLEHIDPGFGFDLITLSASVAESLHSQQTRLDGQVDDGAELARLVDRLTARLGQQAVRCPRPRNSHLPERAEDWPTALNAAPAPAAPRAMRPARVFEVPEEVRVLYAVPEGPPAQFIWRRITHRVTRFAGPERIAPEWWLDKPGTRLRDYYRIEDHLAQRLWLYREGVLGDGRGTTPRWFVHGVFV